MFASWFVVGFWILPLALAYYTVPEVLFSKGFDSSLNLAENAVQQTERHGNGDAVQKCQRLDGQSGECVPLESCLLYDSQNGFLEGKDYSCVLNDRRSLGVCCPYQKENSRTNQREIISKGARKKRLPRSPEEKSAKKQQDTTPPESDRNSRSDDENALDKPYALGDYKTCGLNGRTTSRSKVEAPSSVKDWPWMVAFISRKTKAQFCGGTLITKRHIITAAHCFRTSKNPKDMILLVGDYNLTSSSDSKSKPFEVEKIIIHDDFDPGNTLQDDIAIVVVKRPTTYNSYIQPCCLPAPGAVYANFTAVVTGWGSLGSNKSSSDTLMEVNIPVWEDKVCDNTYIGKVFKTNLCAGLVEGGKDACQGDSGGPLVMQRQDGRWVIVGVVSWGAGCGGKNSPGVYTKVNDYLDWIEDNIK